MAIVTVKTKKDGVRVISSSYFDDMKVVKESLRDTDFQGMRHDKTCTFDTAALKVSATAHMIYLWKLGCRELSEFVKGLNEHQLKKYETKYIGEDYDGKEEILDS